MCRLSLFVAVTFLVASPAPSRSGPTGSDAPAGKKPANELVQVQGKVVGIKGAGKRHQSYIFEFRMSHQLQGPDQVPVARDQLVRVELFEDDGGRDFIVKVQRLDPKDPRAVVKLEDVLPALPKSPHFKVVLWLLPPVDKGATREFDAVLVGAPVALPD